MIALIVSATLSFFLFIILGLFIAKFVKAPIILAEKLFLGLVLSNTLATIISLFAPINSIVLVAFILMLFILAIFVKGELKDLLILIKAKRGLILFSFPFIVLGLVISVIQPQNYDTGLYHLQSIKWIEEYRVIPGLANLHGRFGFNPNVFTLFALTSFSNIFKQEIFSINFTVYSILSFYFINTLYSKYKRSGIDNLFLFNLIVYITVLSLLPNLTSPSPDFLSSSIPLFILARIINLNSVTDKISFESYFSIILLGGYIITVKLSTIPILIFAFLIILIHRIEIRKLKWVFAILVLVVLPWITRNVILTGWIIYPFHLIDLFNFNWKVPYHYVIQESESVTGWARVASEQYNEVAQMNILDWFPLWWDRLSNVIKFLFSASILFPIISILIHLFRKVRMHYYAFIVIFTSFIGVLFWLFLAPDPRFGMSFIVIAAISPLLILNFSLNKIIHNKAKAISILVIVFISGICVSLNLVNFNRISTEIFYAYNNRDILIKPRRIIVPADIDFRKVEIKGVSIFTPSIGDRCYDCDIPCAPKINPALVLRGSNLSSGFMILEK